MSFEHKRGESIPSTRSVAKLSSKIVVGIGKIKKIKCDQPTDQPTDQPMDNEGVESCAHDERSVFKQ